MYLLSVLKGVYLCEPNSCILYDTPRRGKVYCQSYKDPNYVSKRENTACNVYAEKRKATSFLRGYGLIQRMFMDCNCGYIPISFTLNYNYYVDWFTSWFINKRMLALVIIYCYRHPRMIHDLAVIYVILTVGLTLNNQRRTNCERKPFG